MSPTANREDLLDGAGDLADKSTTEGDADIGIMARFGQFRAGLTIRNVTEPDFETPDGGEIELARQTRAGIAYSGLPGLMFAADIDLNARKDCSATSGTWREASKRGCIRALPRGPASA